MTEYIEREAARDAIEEADSYYTYVIDRLPCADVAPVRHGRWEEDMLDGLPGYRSIVLVCSVCHRVGFAGTPYCPNCGALMDGGK